MKERNVRVFGILTALLLTWLTAVGYIYAINLSLPTEAVTTTPVGLSYLPIVLNQSTAIQHPNTQTPTHIASDTPTATSTQRPTNTPTYTVTQTASNTPTYTATQTPTSTPTTSLTPGPGDVNCRDQINVFDGLLILQYDVGLVSSSKECQPPERMIYEPYCNVSNDQVCDTYDGLCVLQYDAHISNKRCPSLPPRSLAVRSDSKQYIKTNSKAMVSIGTYHISSNITVTVPVTASIPVNTELATTMIEVHFDPSVVQVVDASCVIPPPLLGACNPNYGDGVILFNAVSLSGATGELTLAEIIFQAIGRAGESTAIDIEIKSFEDMDRNSIPVSDIDGEITIISTTTPTAIATSTATPQPTYTPIPPTGTAMPSPSPRVTAIATAIPTGTAMPTGTPTRTATPSSTGDPHEPNNTCSQAVSIPTDGTTQIHTFNQPTDDDWVSFEVAEGITYRIEGLVPPSSSADIMVEIYENCERFASGQAPSFSPDIRTEFVSSINGHIYLRLLNENATIYRTDLEYHLSVRALSETAQRGALIIVGGKYRDTDPLQDNIYNVTNRVYDLFLNKGYPKEQIYYLATDPTLDGNGDGVPDVNGLPNTSNLQSAITEWATNYVGPKKPLTLYLIGYGGYDKLYLDRTRQEQLTPDQLDEWLGQLEAQTNTKVNIIIETCQSGSFIDPFYTVSQEGRVIISSTDSLAPSYASQDGAIFSDAFLSALTEDKSLKIAFDQATWAIEEHSFPQSPWLDADGNGIPNQQSDNSEAEQRSFFATGSFPANQWAPYIRKAELREFDGVLNRLSVEVVDDSEVQHVWAIVYPPSYEPPESNEEIVPEEPRISLLKNASVPYGAEYSLDWQFSEIGEYRVVIYAEDGDGLISYPKLIEINTIQKFYLPIFIRQ